MWVLYFISIFLDWRLGFEPALQLAEKLKFESPSKWNSYEGSNLEHWGAPTDSLGAPSEGFFDHWLKDKTKDSSVNSSYMIVRRGRRGSEMRKVAAVLLSSSWTPGGRRARSSFVVFYFFSPNHQPPWPASKSNFSCNPDHLHMCWQTTAQVLSKFANRKSPSIYQSTRQSGSITLNLKSLSSGSM